MQFQIMEKILQNCMILKINMRDDPLLHRRARSTCSNISIGQIVALPRRRLWVRVPFTAQHRGVEKLVSRQSHKLELLIRESRVRVPLPLPISFFGNNGGLPVNKITCEFISKESQQNVHKKAYQRRIIYGLFSP